nr:DUF2525 domain-containing protein [Klebsiella pneumoniae]
MKHQLTGQTGDDLDVNVDALLAAINEISESEVALLNKSNFC